MFGFAKKLVKQAEGIIAPEIHSDSPTRGFRVLHVEPDTEAFHAGIEPLFDFIIAANGTRFDREFHPEKEPDAGLIGRHIIVEQEQSPAPEFSDVVQKTEGKLVLEIWSAKGRSARVVTLPNPSKQTGGLGLTLQWSALSVADHVWHILNVNPGSPADAAGLVSHADYIVAGENGVLEEGGEYALGRVISRTDPSEGVLFYVYNRDFDIVRPVRVFPTSDGKLGCGVGYGLLHSLPKVSKAETRVTPGATVFDDQELHAQYLDSKITEKVPAPTSFTTTTTGPPNPASAPHHPHHHHHHHKPSQGTAAADLESYFAEQSQISKQIDGDSKNTPSSVPPPPKQS